jgi:hypothetical protein
MGLEKLWIRSAMKPLIVPIDWPILALARIANPF